MKRHLASILCATAVGAATAGPLVVDFDFNGPNANLGNTPTFTVGATSITVQAYYAVTNASSPSWTSLASTRVQRNTNALGVRTNGSDRNPGQIDSNLNRVEGLLFDLGTGWSTAEVDFTLLSVADEADIWIGNAFTSTDYAWPLSTQLVDDAHPGDPFTANLAGARYLFIAAAYDGDTTADRCVQGVNCFRINNLRLTQIPEPATLGLTGAALMLLAGATRVARRRR